MKLLFICGKNRLRSPTAEHIFSQKPGLEVASAGVDRDADERVSGDLSVSIIFNHPDRGNYFRNNFHFDNYTSSAVAFPIANEEL